MARASYSRNRFKRTVAGKTHLLIKNDGLDVLIYLAYIQFLSCLSERIEARKNEEGTKEAYLGLCKRAAEDVLPEFQG